MDYKEIQDLLKFISKSEISEVKIKEGEFELIVRNKNYSKSGAPIPYVQAPAVQSIQASVPSVEMSPEVSASSAPPAEEAKNSTAGLLEIKSPIVGTFYRSSSPDKPVFVSVGDSVKEGSIVCIVEAMKLFNEIESEVTGKIVKVLVEDASPVEYDQVLFLVDPKG